MSGTGGALSQWAPLIALLRDALRMLRMLRPSSQLSGASGSCITCAILACCKIHIRGSVGALTLLRTRGAAPVRREVYMRVPCGALSPQKYALGNDVVWCARCTHLSHARCPTQLYIENLHKFGAACACTSPPNIANPAIR